MATTTTPVASNKVGGSQGIIILILNIIIIIIVTIIITITIIITTTTRLSPSSSPPPAGGVKCRQQNGSLGQRGQTHDKDSPLPASKLQTRATTGIWYRGSPEGVSGGSLRPLLMLKWAAWGHLFGRRSASRYITPTSCPDSCGSRSKRGCNTTTSSSNGIGDENIDLRKSRHLSS